MGPVDRATFGPRVECAAIIAPGRDERGLQPVPAEGEVRTRGERDGDVVEAVGAVERGAHGGPAEKVDMVGDGDPRVACPASLRPTPDCARASRSSVSGAMIVSSVVALVARLM